MALPSKFSAFTVIDTTYKTINSTPIPASILIPKTIPSGPCSIHIRFHGGGLLAGHRLYPDWFADWILEFAATQNAVVISPDYRLLPEACGLDVLQDLRDFYAWLLQDGNLSALLPPGVRPDLAHLLVSGESAGGWCVLQSVLFPDVRERVAAAIAQYPMVDLRDGHFTKDYEKQLFTPPMPQIDREVLDSHLRDMDKDSVVTSSMPPDRLPLVLSTLQQGRFGDFFGQERVLYPLEALVDGGVRALPPLWIIHGKEDTMVPVQGTQKWERALRELVPGSELLVHYEDGAEHGFDNAPGVNLETEWVKEGVRFLGRFWPKSSI